MFGVDVEGWVEQNRSRDLYELVREPVQNALDTGSDLSVFVDYGDQSVAIEDYDPDGVEDLSRFYDLFSGNKQYDPEKRGRFGRGVKEFIGATDVAVIQSTGGGLRFDFDPVYDESEGSYTVEASRDFMPDADREAGTLVYGSSEEWGEADLREVEAFVGDLWMPEDQELYLETFSPYSEETVSGVDPDAVLDDIYLPTVVFEDGLQKEKIRNTSVEVTKTSPGEGGVYELGIPVTQGESFPFTFNVHQKTPVTERRNELDNSYRSELMQALIDERLDLLGDDELGESYVTDNISHFSHQTSEEVQEEYIRRRFGNSPEEILVFDSSTPDMAVTWAVQRGLPMENLEEYSLNVQGVLDQNCPTVHEWYQGQQEGRSIQQVEEISKAQEEFLDFLEEGILGRTSSGGVDFELAYISEDTEDGRTEATYSPADNTVYLNALVDDWDEPTPQRIGTALHEIGHHETDPTRDGHGPNWYHAVEELSGEVIQNLLEGED